MVFNKLFEQRAVSYQSLFASGDDISLGTLSGVTLNNETVFQVNAVFSAVSLISDTISTLPVDAYYRDGETRTPYRPKPAGLTNRILIALVKRSTPALSLPCCWMVTLSFGCSPMGVARS